jgi:hypothetical protein
MNPHVKQIMDQMLVGHGGQTGIEKEEGGPGSSPE